jgi:lipoprotein-releasing system permease protein
MKTWPFFRYFFHYILGAKTRQKLLFIAVSGLFLSSFSLIFIQGIMGGLQKSLVNRSKSVNGSQVLRFRELNTEDLAEMKDLLRKKGISFYSELEVEVMLKGKNFVSPSKLHGIDLDDERPGFLADRDFKGLVMGSDLASKMRLKFFDDVQIISPSVTDSLMGEVPRFVSDTLSDYVYSEVSEVDEFESWIRLSLVQNLLRQRGVNQIRLFGDISTSDLTEIKNFKTEVPFEIVSWEQMNGALVWSLNLETKVMLFLFISMSFLVAISITSGLLIFFSKIRKDVMSFWILGMSQKRLLQLCLRFTLGLAGFICLIGCIAGAAGLRVLESYGHDIMPDIFVERTFPVDLSPSSIMTSFLIPFGISIVFSFFSFAQFRKENQSFVDIVRSLS